MKYHILILLLLLPTLTQASSPILTVDWQDRQTLHISWSDAPATAQIVVAGNVVGGGSSGALDHPTLSVALFDSVDVVDGAAVLASVPIPPVPLFAVLAASWQGDTLIVQAAPGCLYLEGNNRPRQFVDCDQATYALPMYGDVNLVAPGRTLVLMSLDGQTETARLKVPSRYSVWMPWVAG